MFGRILFIIWVFFGLETFAGVVINEGKDIYELGLHMDILEDFSGKLTIDEVSGPEWENKFKKSKEKVPNFGYSKGPYWIRISIENKNEKQKKWFLSWNTIYNDKIQFFKKEKKKWIFITTGDAYPFSTREFESRFFIFKIFPSKISQYFFRIETEAGVGALDLNLLTPEKFAKVESKNNLFFGILFGLIAAMILYNLFIFFSTKNISYIYYVLYCTSFGLFIFSYQGFGQVFLYKNFVWMNSQGQGVLISLVVVFVSLFTDSFLKLKESTPFLYKVIIFFRFMGALFILLIFLVPYSIVAKLLYPTILTSFPFLFYVGLYRMKMNYRPAKYFIVSLFLFIIGGIITTSKAMGLLPSNFFTDQAVFLGHAIQLILLSMGLADEFNYQQEKSLKVEKELALDIEMKKIQIEEELNHSIVMQKKEKDLAWGIELKKIQLEEELNQSIELYNKVQEANKGLELKVKERTKEIIKIQEDRSLFFAKLSHELRTPLNAVLGFSSILLGKNKEESQEKDFLESIHSSGRSLLNLVNSVHDFTKIDLNELKVVKKKMPLIKFLKEASLYYTNECINKGINFFLELDDELPHWIESDEQRLRQVFDNFLSNALKFTEKGHLKIKARHSLTDEKDKVNVIFEIEDTGRGMVKEKIDKLFQAFGQVHEEGSVQERGTGLGLYISKQILEKLGGEVEVISSFGKGTVFTLTLRNVSVFIDEIETEDIVNYTFFGDTVLIVDDIPVNITLLEAYLSPFNLRIETARNGKELLERVKKTNPSLIITDLKMPVMTGENALKKIKEEGINTPIILVSALVVDESIKKEFQGFLHKPVEEETFIKEVSRFLKHEVNKSEITDSNKEMAKFFIPDNLDKKEKDLLLDIKSFMLRGKEDMDITFIESYSSKLKERIKETKLYGLEKFFDEMEVSASTFNISKVKTLLKEGLNKVEEGKF